LCQGWRGHSGLYAGSTNGKFMCFQICTYALRNRWESNKARHHRRLQHPYGLCRS
jgi:hypothetical protein